MAKRKLSRRQKWRIEKIQSEKASRAEKKANTAHAEINSSDLGPEQKGRIISHYGQSLDVEPLEAPETESKEYYRCFVRANLGALVTGDIVVWRSGENNTGVIEALMPRQSLLQRPDNYGLLKPVAANIDRIIIVIASEPVPHRNLIDRYLVAAETLDIQATLLCNKSDLINDDNRDELEAILNDYSELGYEVLKTSAFDLESQESELLAWLSQHTSVFVGQSGVGKSSIIRSLLGDESIKVGALSETTRKGTHTTTTAKLFDLPDGGFLVDSPGIREFGLWHINHQELLEGFVEFRPLLGHCRFRDCKHENEPGCAILEALESGKISSERMESFERIKQGLDDLDTYTH